MRVSARLGRAIAAGVLSLTAVVGFAGCQFQTLQQYPPANGVSATSNGVMVRNLVIVATAPGEGVLVGAVVVDNKETLSGVTGIAHLSNGDDGAALQFTMAAPLQLTKNTATNLSEHGIAVSSPDLRAGLTATVELTFRDAGTITVTLPVMDAASPEYSNLERPTS